MPYPPRPQLQPRPEFVGTRYSKDRLLLERLEAFIVASYRDEGRSLREVAELVDRSQTAVRRALEKHQVRRRSAGAAPVG